MAVQSVELRVLMLAVAPKWFEEARALGAQHQRKEECDSVVESLTLAGLTLTWKYFPKKNYLEVQVTEEETASLRENKAAQLLTMVIKKRVLNAPRPIE